MNERIWELARQAYSNDMPYDSNIPDEFILRLAELIVRECAEVLDTWNKENGAEEGLDKAGLISLWSPHFGVEE